MFKPPILSRFINIVLDVATISLQSSGALEVAFSIFMLYILIHTVLAVEFVVVLWNWVSILCTLYVLKGADRR